MEQDINKHFIPPEKCGDLVQVDPERRYGKPESDGGLAFGCISQCKWNSQCVLLTNQNIVKGGSSNTNSPCFL
jgi:hypothetical protein